MAFIQAEALTKRYTVSHRQKGALGALRGLFHWEVSVVEALKGVSFAIERGELVGYIGPNGAGKSTTIKLLTGILTPESGTVTIDGRIPWRDRKAHAAHIGVVFGQRTQLWWDIPVQDSFDLLRDIYRITPEAYRRRFTELVDTLDLASVLATPLRQLSLGQRMRCELAGSLLHSPELLFLDEPTIGLDAVSKLAVRDFLQRENAEHGTTVLLTTHDMDDIEALARRVMVLGHGSLLYDGALTELIARYDTEHHLKVSYATGALPLLPEGLRAEPLEGGWRIHYDPVVHSLPDVIALLQTGGTLRDFKPEPKDIDAVIADLYREMAL